MRDDPEPLQIADDGRPVVGLREQLRAFSKSDYCVNEKVPPSYVRKWKLYVLWPDGSSKTYWGEDSEAGYERVYRDALLDARRLGLTAHIDGNGSRRAALIDGSGDR